MGLHALLRRRLLLRRLYDRFDTRLGQHQAGTHAGYTAMRRPVELVWSEEFQHLDDAIAAERQIKGWSRAKKQALILGDYATISRLSSRAQR